MPFSQSGDDSRFATPSEHAAECVSLLSDFLVGKPIMLTTSSCREYLNHACPCGGQHTSAFISECAREAATSTRVLIRPHRLLSFGPKSVIRLVSIAMENSGLYDIRQRLERGGFPKGQQVMHAYLGTQFAEYRRVTKEDHASFRVGMEGWLEANNCKMESTLTTRNMPNVWFDRHCADASTWGEASRRVLSGMVAVRLTAQGHKIAMRGFPEQRHAGTCGEEDISPDIHPFFTPMTIESVKPDDRFTQFIDVEQIALVTSLAPDLLGFSEYLALQNYLPSQWLFKHSFDQLCEERAMPIRRVFDIYCLKNCIGPSNRFAFEQGEYLNITDYEKLTRW